MSNEGLKLAARFAWSADKCAGQENKSTLLACVEDNTFTGVESALMEYGGMIKNLAYITTVLNQSGRSHDLFDLDVVTAYWLGSPVLEAFRHLTKPPLHAYKVLQEARIMHKRKKPDAKIKDHVRNCSISWGRIDGLSDQQLIVYLNYIGGPVGDYKIDRQPTPINYRRGFLPELPSGQSVAVHNNWAVLAIDQKQEEQLRNWTGEVIDIFNSAKPVDRFPYR
jgi:hypothetical protein